MVNLGRADIEEAYRKILNAIETCSLSLTDDVKRLHYLFIKKDAVEPWDETRWAYQEGDWQQKALLEHLVLLDRARQQLQTLLQFNGDLFQQEPNLSLAKVRRTP